MREVPDAVRDDEVDRSVPDRERFHRRQHEQRACLGAVAPIPALALGPFEHRPREVGPEHPPPARGERQRIARGAAPDVERHATSSFLHP
ncbi:MAG: hypothetical protein U0P82_19565 [Vicinamibacterales bacterium]